MQVQLPCHITLPPALAALLHAPAPLFSAGSTRKRGRFEAEPGPGVFGAGDASGSGSVDTASDNELPDGYVYVGEGAAVDADGDDADADELSGGARRRRHRNVPPRGHGPEHRGRAEAAAVANVVVDAQAAAQEALQQAIDDDAPQFMLFPLAMQVAEADDAVDRVGHALMDAQHAYLAHPPPQVGGGAPYGDVAYADPGFRGKPRYPIDTRAHVRAAWAYIHVKRNAAKYSPAQLRRVVRAIAAAAPRFGVSLSGSGVGDHGGTAAAATAGPDKDDGVAGRSAATFLSWTKLPDLTPDECFPLASVDGGKRDKRFLWLIGGKDARAPLAGGVLDGDARLEGGAGPARPSKRRRGQPDDAPLAGMHGPEDWQEKPDGPSPALTACDASAPRLRVDLPVGEEFKLEPTHDADGRDIWYITGTSGCGKTRMARWLAERYRALWPDRAIHYVSFKEEPDRAMPTRKSHPDDPVRVTRLLHEKLAQTPLPIKSLSRSLLIVDDVDNLLAKKPKAGRAVQLLVNDVCLTGRSHAHGDGAVSLVYITHNASNYLQTRTLASEANYIVFFPRGLAAVESLNRMLLNFGGPACDREAVKAAMSTDAAWVAIRKRYPFALISEGSARIMPVGKFG